MIDDFKPYQTQVFALPSPASRGNLSFYLGELPTAYVGEIKIEAFDNDDYVGSSRLVLSKPRRFKVRSFQLAKGPDELCGLYDFSRPATRFKIHFDLRPAFPNKKSETVEYRHFTEDVRVRILEKR